MLHYIEVIFRFNEMSFRFTEVCFVLWKCLSFFPPKGYNLDLRFLELRLGYAENWFDISNKFLFSSFHGMTMFSIPVVVVTALFGLFLFVLSCGFCLVWLNSALFFSSVVANFFFRLKTMSLHRRVSVGPTLNNFSSDRVFVIVWLIIGAVIMTVSHQAEICLGALFEVIDLNNCCVLVLLSLLLILVPTCFCWGFFLQKIIPLVVGWRSLGYKYTSKLDELS